MPLIASLQLKTNRIVSDDVFVALRRFSGLGHLAVATVLATGALTTWLILGALPLDLSSPYQTLLLTKIALVVIMIILALMNRYVLLPRLHGALSAVRLLRWSAIGELVAGLAAIGLVSALGILPPTQG